MNLRNGELSRRSFLTGVAGASALGAHGTLNSSQSIPTLSLLPFLARPRATSILINARNGHTDAVAGLEVRRLGESQWSPSGNELNASPGEFLNWTLEGLTAATRYEYRVFTAVPGGDPAPVARGSFTTQRNNEQGFTAALIADAHAGAFVDGSGPFEVLDEVIRNVRRERPDFVIALGDNVAWTRSRDQPQGDDLGATRAYTMYRQHIAPLSMMSPHFGLIGNWEGESGKFPAESKTRTAAVRRRFLPGPNDVTYPQGAVQTKITTPSTGGPLSL